MTGGEGTARLIGPILRRDRFRLVVWASSIVLLVLATVASTKGLYPTQADLDRAAATSADNPSAAAFNGPLVALDTLGGQIAFQIGAFGLALGGLMSLLLTSRFTRGEEDSGRLELVRALPVGRHAPLLAATIVVAALNVVVGALTTLTLAAYDLPVAGSLAMGASFLAVGLVFTGVTALTAQVSENPRVASGLAGAVLAVSFAVRAIGDAGSGALSWVSPIGLAQKSRPYGGEMWWPLVLCVAIGVGLFAVALRQSARRDFSLGLFPPRPGPATAPPSLASALGLAVRLGRGAVLWWTVGALTLALVFGSLASSIEDFADDSEVLEDYFASGGSLTDSFLSTSVLLVALVAGGAAVQLILRARVEESDGRAEVLLAAPTSRTRWLASHVIVATLGSTGVLLAGALGLGIAAAPVLHDAGQIPRALLASLAYLPATAVITAAAITVIGLAPRATGAVWALWSLSLVLGMFGTLIEPPSAIRDLSPFEHVPSVPAEPFRATPIVVLAVVAIGLSVAGDIAMRRRDVGV